MYLYIDFPVKNHSQDLSSHVEEVPEHEKLPVEERQEFS